MEPKVAITKACGDKKYNQRSEKSCLTFYGGRMCCFRTTHVKKREDSGLLFYSASIQKETLSEVKKASSCNVSECCFKTI